MIKLLIAYRIPVDHIKGLDTFDITYPEQEEFSLEELEQLIPGQDILLCTFTQPIPKKLLEKADKLKMISNYGVGFNNIDIDYASERGMVVCNTPGPVTEPTAEMALALMLDLSRRVSELDRKLRSNQPPEWGVMRNLGHTLWNKKLGIIGMGNIGKATARRALAMGMEIFYNKRNPLSEEEENKIQATYLTKEELLKTCDVISLHIPLNRDTKYLIGRKELAMMKDSAIIINTARGAVIQESELVLAIKNHVIAGAGLDVFEFEPKISKELLEMDQVVLAPHNGTGTVETRTDISDMAFQNIFDYLEGKDMEYQVNK